MTRLGPRRLRILGLVIAGQRRGRAPKYKELRLACGCSQRNVTQHLTALRDAGLVTWEFHRAGTVVPLVRFIPAAELEAL